LNQGPKHLSTNIIRPDSSQVSDNITVEEPLEIWISHPDESGSMIEFTLNLTMRTPGDDKALVTGFLFCEGIISSLADIEDFEFFGPRSDPLQIQNQVKVTLKSDEKVRNRELKRYFYSNSSCGVCGKASIQALALQHEPDLQDSSFLIEDKKLRALPRLLRTTQGEFIQTGGLHGIALVNSAGRILLTKEDVGRHNALDKLIGGTLMSEQYKGSGNMILVSGRASFELVQKALMADISFLASIGAPSSAAVDLAKAYNMTLLGFLKETTYNIYNGAHRIKLP